MSDNKHIVPWFVIIAWFCWFFVTPAQAALTDGLVAYYPFDGNANDASGNGNNGIIHGGVTLTTDRSGNIDSAYQFNGTDGYISVPDSASLNPTDQLTISFWLRVDSFTSEWSAVIHKGGASADCSSNREYSIWLNTSSYIHSTSAGDGNCQNYINSPFIHLINTWNLFTFVVDRHSAHTMQIYVNGALLGQVDDTYASFNNNSAELRIGSNEEVVGGLFNGALDDIRIYNRALSAAEIQQLYSYTQIYSNDFSNSAGPEWSDPTISTSNDESFLADSAYGSGPGSNILTLNNLPTHNYLQVSFDLYIITSWDGNGENGWGPDNWQLTADGNNVFLSNFANCPGNTQAYPNQLPPYGLGGSFPLYNGALTTGHLGFGIGQDGDTTYRLSLIFPHTASTVALAFTGIEGQPPSDEGWGLDNVTVGISNTYTVTPSTVLAAGGTITPNTAQTVNYGASTTFAITPDPGYSIASVSGCGGSLSGNNYTTGTITADCTVFAAFKNNSQPSGINDTGITTCGNASQNGLSCPVSDFLRQDAEYGPNTFSFTKLDAAGNPLPDTATNHTCVRDNYTGLIWEVKTYDGGLRDKDHTYTFDQAPAFATAVNTTGGLCGFTDWRVPSPQELRGLIDFSVPYPGPTINTDYFPNTPGTGFWTSAPYAIAPSNAWIVYFSYGHVYYYNRASSGAVRLVRGEQALSSFHDNGDGTITDANTGLTWAQCAQGQSGSNCAGTATTMNWSQALTSATTSTLAGYNDWRLPNVKELNSIVNYNRHDPSIDTAYFPNTPVARFWSSSPYAYISGNAWFVGFANGYDSAGTRPSSSAVRLVRGGQYLSSFLLNVGKTGNGGGSVTSDPVGIDCGNTCSANFGNNSSVTLTATPDTNSVFIGWSGDVGCDVGTLTLDSGKICIANFILMQAPTPIPDQPSFITKNSARINGTVNENGAVTTVSFDYGLNTNYGNSIDATPSTINIGSGVTPVIADISGLTCGTIYHYRIKAANSIGIVYSSDASFTTSACSPIVAYTGSASKIAFYGATLSGIINVGDAPGYTTAIFQYSTDTSYGTAVQASTYNIPSGTNNVVVNAAVVGLKCATSYHYRVRAGNGTFGLVPGNDRTFTTTQCTVATTNPTSDTTSNSATFNGIIDVGGALGPTTAVFQYSTDLSYSKSIMGNPYTINAGANSVIVTAYANGFNCNTTYHYRIKAGNDGGTFYGDDQPFTTTACGTLSYVVTPILGIGGTVTPNTPQTVTANTAKSFTVAPKIGYIKSSKGITGTCPLGNWSGNVWTTGNITANCSVKFDFFCLACVPVRGGWRMILGWY